MPSTAYPAAVPCPIPGPIADSPAWKSFPSYTHNHVDPYLASVYGQPTRLTPKSGTSRRPKPVRCSYLTESSAHRANLTVHGSAPEKIGSKLCKPDQVEKSLVNQ